MFRRIVKFIYLLIQLIGAIGILYFVLKEALK